MAGVVSRRNLAGVDLDAENTAQECGGCVEMAVSGVLVAWNPVGGNLGGDGSGAGRARPSSISALLLTHDKIADVAVIGVPSSAAEASTTSSQRTQ